MIINGKESGYCPIRLLLDMMSNKWSWLIMYELSNKFDHEEAQPIRFNELAKSIDGISQKMLTQSLRLLEKEGFVRRKVYPVVPPKVEYSLTDLGRSFIPIIRSLSHWADSNYDEIEKARKKFDRSRKSA